MADHARHRQAAARRLLAIVGAVAPLGVGHDRLAAGLVEGDRLGRLLGGRGDGDHGVRALRVSDGELQRLHAVGGLRPLVHGAADVAERAAAIGHQRA